MKKTILTAAGISMLFLSACTRSSSSSSSSSNLNSTETQLIGTWKLTKEADTAYTGGALDTSETKLYTPMGTIPYIQFTSTSCGCATSQGKSCTDAATLGTAASAFGSHANYITAQTYYWYYDTNNSILNIYLQPYKIVTVTSSQLVLKWTNPLASTMYTVLYFQKS